MNMYTVAIKRKYLREISRLPKEVIQRFDLLYEVLKQSGPAGPYQWQNYSKLSENEYHCHLNYRYVACWRCEKKSIVVEVYYVGSRENAPYA